MKQKLFTKNNLTLPEKPNLLIIITDEDRGLMHFPPGWEEQHLTAMPRLRNNGITFTNAFCSACMCSPSRATLLTGLYPAQHEVTLTLTENMTYSNDEITLSQKMQNIGRMLHAGGYDVNYIGKWHLSKGADGTFGTLTTEDLETYGFKGWVPPDAGEDTAPEHYGAGAGYVYNADGELQYTNNNDLNYVNQAIDYLYEVQRNYNNTDTNREYQRPFALFLSLVNPHDVLAYPGPAGNTDFETNFAPEYLKGNIGLPATVHENLKETHKPTVQQMFIPYAAIGLGALPNDEMKTNYINFYGNLITHADHQLNTVLDVLYQVFDTASGRSLADDTIVIRTADHGEMGMAHGGMRQKTYNAYEETLSIPLVISNPILFPKPRTTTQLFSLVDLMPTVNGLLNLDNPLNYTFKGVDMSPVIRHPNTVSVLQDAILFTFDDFRAGNANSINPLPAANRIRCIREKRWKYAFYFYIAPPQQDPPQSYPNEYEMYDLENDPFEISNLASPENKRYNDPEIAAERKRLQEKLKAVCYEKLGETIQP